jgi:catechol 2,3-dioxygenase-like lactoylglutathione lyase family enzyme
MKKNITGIQQIGIGVRNVHEAFEWYRNVLGMDIRIFEEKATAELMLHYTDGKPRERHAILALNMHGGGGFEVWQHTGHQALDPVFDLQLGDTGIYVCKLKTHDISLSLEYLQSKKVNVLSGVEKNPANVSHFMFKDPFGNIFQMVEDASIYEKSKVPSGGTFGAIIGVSNMENSMRLYHDVLGYDQIEYDQSAVFHDFKTLAGGEQKLRRVLLKHSQHRKGAFSKILGPTEIELVQALDRKPKPIYKDRIWGDMGFIHICFDINGMELLKEECEKAGFPFTVDSSNSFDMGEAAGHFAYVSDPDGTPVEFVETHKVPVMKKIGWYINLKNRNPLKSLPVWVLKGLKLNRVKK